MDVEKDPTVWAAGGGIGGLAMAYLYRIFRTIKGDRTDDRKAENIHNGYDELIQQLRDEVQRLAARLDEAEKHIKACEDERLELLSEVQGIRRSYGQRKTDSEIGT